MDIFCVKGFDYTRCVYQIICYNQVYLNEKMLDCLLCHLKLGIHKIMEQLTYIDGCPKLFIYSLRIACRVTVNCMLNCFPYEL